MLHYIEANRGRFLEELKTLLRFESVSADPARKGEVQKTAQFEIDHLKKIGFENAKLVETGGHPIVYADFLHAVGKPTILVYGHYDVQPPDPLELWKTPPFTPTIQGNFIYGRGASDNKGMHWTHLCALESHLKMTGKLPVNVKILIEGEEELTHEHIDATIRKNPGLFSCDAVLLSDTGWFSDEYPTICTGLRGLDYFQITLTGPDHDLHSGTYGGKVRNPINTLAHILAQLKDEKGHVLVPHFYDDVLPIGPQEKENLKNLPWNDAVLAREVGMKHPTPEEGFSTLESNWYRPSLDINGIWGGYQGPGAKTVIASTCGAKFSTRLVAKQDPHKIATLVTDHVRSLCPPEITCKIEVLSTAPPVHVDSDNFFVRAAAQGYEKGFGKKVMLAREGASIPVVATFQEVLKVPVVLMGLGLSTDRIHSPNESFCLDNFYGGIIGAAHTYQLFAQ